MAITIVLPSYLQRFAGGRTELEVEGSASTVGEALDALRAAFPGVYDRVITERGEVRQHVNVFVGEESIREGGDLACPVRDGSEVVILPAVSGG